MFQKELKAYACRPKLETDYWVGKHMFPEGEPPTTSKPIISSRYIDEDGEEFFISYTEEQVETNRKKNFGFFCPFIPLLICGPMPTSVITAKPKPVLTFRTKKALSASISLHVSNSSMDECKHHNGMTCPTTFQLSKWVPFSIDQHHICIWKRTIETQRITMPIDACWVERFERRSQSELIELGAVLITAGDLQGLQLYHDEADKDMKEYAQAVSVFLRALPRNWPVVVYAV